MMTGAQRLPTMKSRKAKVRHLWHLGSSRVQAWYITPVLIVLKKQPLNNIITRHPVVAAIICHAL